MKPSSDAILGHRILTTIGLCADALGAILLGVEAIKLQNVRHLRDWLDSRGHKLFSTINPEIVVVDGHEPRSRSDSVAGALAIVLYLAAALALGGCMLYGLYEVARNLVGAPSVMGLPWWGVILVTFGAGFVALMLATLLMTAAETLLKVLLLLIEKLDEHTLTGGVGIVGAILLVAGFALQVVATWTQ
jgi:hypothetical protein